MIVSAITFDDWNFRIRVHRPKGFAFLYENGQIIGRFYLDRVTKQLRFKIGRGEKILESRLTTLLDIVRSML